MTDEAVKWMTKIETEAKRVLGRLDIVWDNRHPTYRAANEAFEASDVKALKKIWKDNFC